MSNLSNKNLFFYLSVLYIVIISLLYIVSKNIIMSNFIDIESKVNKQNLNSVITNIDKDMNNLKNTTKDYSKWDDTYDFILGNNNNYIYENFREGSYTLEDLNIDGMIFVHKNKNILYSSYNNETLLLNKVYLEKNILNKYINEKEFSTIISYQNKYFYLIKANILKSDSTGNVNGYLYSLKEISKSLLNSYNKVFSSIEVLDSYNLVNTNIISINNLDVSIDVVYEKEKLINYITMFDKINKEQIFYIKTIAQRDFIQDIKDNIIFINLFLSIILFALFVIFYKFAQLSKIKTINLDEEIKKKTKQLENAYNELIQKNHELTQLVNYDTLTKVYNRRSYFENSKKELRRAINEDLTFYVLIIDLDHFKKINDTFGHAAGDKVLIEFCEIVKSCISEEDIFARIGGEEFCITFVNKSEDEVTTICENISQKSQNSIITFNDKEITFTISMGLSSRGELVQIDNILQNADKLLYKAKNNGRNKLYRS